MISSFAIQSPTALKKYGANQGELRGGVFYPTGSYAFSHPTGTGPFKFLSWTVGEKVELVRNNAYWGKKPRIKALIIRPIANNTARLQALQTGEIQGYDLVEPQDIADDQEQLQAEGRRPAVVQRRLRDDQPGGRLAVDDIRSARPSRTASIGRGS